MNIPQTISFKGFEVYLIEEISRGRQMISFTHECSFEGVMYPKPLPNAYVSLLHDLSYLYARNLCCEQVTAMLWLRHS